MKVIAAAVPVGLLHAIYVSVVNHHMQNTVSHENPAAYIINVTLLLGVL